MKHKIGTNLLAVMLILSSSRRLGPEFIVVAQTDLSTSQAQSPQKISGD